eukprot:EST43056.1 Sir2 family protein [Spironucleus salmonicida]
MNPEITFSAILGAGISVSSGLSAFRSTNSIFQKMQVEYESWPEKSTEIDSFLQYAFSVKCLLNDPRVHYRVLSKFDSSTHDKLIIPSISHCFLSYLCEIDRIDRIISQNIDNLEYYSGITNHLKNRHIPAHGEFFNNLVCPNSMCSGFQLNIQLRNLDTDIESIKNQVFTSNFHQHLLRNSHNRQFFQLDSDLKINENAVLFDKQLLQSILLDNAVPMCQFCGCALKSNMVLYGEEIQVKKQHLETILRRSQSILIIGTSMNVFPINALVLNTAGKVSVHFVAKDINFQKYLSQRLISEKKVIYDLILRKYNVIKYKNSEKHKQLLIGASNGKITSDEDINNSINHVTPLVCFHKGNIDNFVLEVLKHCPDAKTRVYEIFEESKKKVELCETRNYIEWADNYIIYKSVKYIIKQVILIIPELWIPDSVIYKYNEKYCNICVCTEQQIELIKFRYQDLVIQSYSLDGVLIIEDTRYICNDEKLDEICYKPINGHYASYCVGYNAYDLMFGEYIEELDPWSSNFLGYQKKLVYYEKTDFFTYSGVYRNYLTIKGISDTDIKEYFKKNMVVLESKNLIIVK